MKKAMLFIVALMFSFGASAASLNLVLDDANGGNAQVDPTSGSWVAASASNSGATSATPDLYTLTATNSGTLTFSGSLHPSASASYFEVLSGGVSVLTLAGAAATGLFDASLFLDAGTYAIRVFSEGAGYNFRVATPIPAALFLFAPALLGFIGLRRKAKLAA